MSLLDAYEEGTLQTAKAMDAAPLPKPVPEPKHSAWTVLPRALAGAALEVAGNLVDVGSMIGQVAEGETRDYGDFEPLNTRPEASRPHYEMAREMRPDPLTAGLAENVIFGVGKGLTKAGAAVAAGGPILGAAAFGLSEGMTTSEDLAEQGVDAATRQKVGTVTGVVSGASVILPVAGTSLLKTAGLVAAGGPAAYIAQETIIKDILEDADYQKIADQHDPLDPVGLAVSTLLPAAFGAMAMRGAFKGKATQEELDAAMVHNTTIKADQFEAETPKTVEAMKQAEDSVKDIRATYEHTGDIGKTITERLMDIGVPPQEAADKGLLWDSFFKSMSDKTGQDAQQLFSKYYDRVFNAGEALPEDAIMQSAHLETPEFKGWFGDSKVVDAEGKPLVVYRGEGRGGERNVYDSSQSRENAIFMTPEKDVARVYEKGNAEPRAFYVKAERLLDLTEDTRETRKFIREWAKNWDDWTDRQSGEQVDPVDVVFGGRLFDYEGDWSSERWRDLQATALENHDAAYLVDWHDGPFKALIVKGGSQIKSATGNRGTFDPNDPNILKQSAPVFYSQLSKSIEDAPAKVFGTGKQLKGEFGNKQEAEKARDPNDPDMQPAIILTDAMKAKAQEGMPLFQGNRGFLEFKGSKMGIGLLASADRSTFLHESGHFFLEVMNDLSKEAEPLRADIDALHQWMGVQGDTPEARAQAWDAMSLDEKRPMHEQFARGFEQYLMEGKAPNSRLAEAFARFRDWLIEIYKSATALNVQITDEVRAVMDRMLDSKAKAPQSPPGGDVPPPRVMAGEATAADLDKVLASGEPNLENHKPLSDPDVQGMLQDMALNEAGWAEKGGYLLRSGSEVAGEEVISRTKWIPKAEWWADRPAQGKRRLNEEQVKEAVRKAIAGEPLKPLEQSTVDFMAAIANDRIQGVEQVGPNGWDDAMQWVNRFNEPPTTENVFDYLAMERAIEINPEAANAAMDAYNIHNDDALVMAEFRSIINEKIQQDSQSVSGGAGEGGGEKPAGQPDPIEAEARRIADADPSRTISLGTDANGEPVKMTVAEYLDAAKMEADQARKDVSLIQAAAECLMGNL